MVPLGVNALKKIPLFSGVTVIATGGVDVLIWFLESPPYWPQMW